MLHKMWGDGRTVLCHHLATWQETPPIATHSSRYNPEGSKLPISGNIRHLNEDKGRVCVCACVCSSFPRMLLSIICIKCEIGRLLMLLIINETCVSFLPSVENLDAMIAMQTKNKLGKSLGTTDFMGPNGKWFSQPSFIAHRWDSARLTHQGVSRKVNDLLIDFSLQSLNTWPVSKLIDFLCIV